MISEASFEADGQDGDRTILLAEESIKSEARALVVLVIGLYLLGQVICFCFTYQSLDEVLEQTFFPPTKREIAEQNLREMEFESFCRMESINMAMVSFVQAKGRKTACTEWKAANSQDEKYQLLKSYLAFAPNSFDDFIPPGYLLIVPMSLEPLSRVILIRPDGTRVEY